MSSIRKKLNFAMDQLALERCVMLQLRFGPTTDPVNFASLRQLGADGRLEYIDAALQTAGASETEAHDVRHILSPALGAEAAPIGADREQILDLTRADDIDILGDILAAAGHMESAELAYRRAADIDLQDPAVYDTWGGAFNGQFGRRAIFKEIIKLCKVKGIVETGTFRGSTTEYMASKTKLPIMSCEKKPRYFYFATARLKPLLNAAIEMADSRDFLRQVIASNRLPSGATFVYLDAHWDKDMPLWEELRILSQSPLQTAIMIDDFRVPGSPGYAYDDYGPDDRLTIENLLAKTGFGWDIFIPQLPASKETGAKRGCVVLAKETLADVLGSKSRLLRRLRPEQALAIETAGNSLSVIEQTSQKMVQSLDDRIIRVQSTLAEMSEKAGSEIGHYNLLAEQLQAQIEKLGADLVESKQMELAKWRYDAIRYELLAAQLQAQIGKLSADVAETERLKVLLQKEAVDAQTALRVARDQIETLTAMVHKSDADSAARLEQNAELSAKMSVREQQIVELQNSRWQRVGERLGLAKKASFEKN